MGKSTILWAICQVAESYLKAQRKPTLLDLNVVSNENDFYSHLCYKIGIPESRGYSLTRNLRNQRILLAIDNIGKLTWPEFSSDIQDNLRGSSEGENAPFKLIVEAREPLNELFKNNQDKGRRICPLAEIYLEENLEAWDESTIRGFIQNRLAKTSVRFTEEKIIQLVQKSGGNPKQLMQLCYQTYSQYMEDENKDGQKN